MLREDIAEAETVVIETELNPDIAVFFRLLERNEHLVITIMYTTFLSPYGCPPIVMDKTLGSGHHKAVHQTVGITLDRLFFLIVIEISA